MRPPTHLGADAEHVPLIDRLTYPLATPSTTAHTGQAQSLARGAAGVALWHIHQAHRNTPGARTRAHRWVQAALAEPVSNADTAGLFAGLPAITFVVHTAQDLIPEYESALEKLDAHLIRLTHRRVDAALARIDRGEPASFAEYDLLRGLTGIGQVLLHFLPTSDALERILRYLVRLTRPIRVEGDTLPGWWVGHGPDPSLPTPGGHANLGLAHGIAGPLALLATATRADITVQGQQDAVHAFCADLDQWRQNPDTGSWWPYWITRDNHTQRHITQRTPGRPSWCYGTPGIARTYQLAALATGDTARRHTAETALASCLADDTQLNQITDLGLCHGWAGLYATAARAAADSSTPALTELLPSLAQQLLRNAATSGPSEDGFLDGAAGLALALSEAADSTAPSAISGWDRCLLIT
ncbi:lanthionine synthetase C family protein [Amycolatopsis aidingensis]|uniref:lanthionine synthetase C family protein n=1 Tax=Amycolatopsis aidingensis TaxID=2842453 RepID=UPI001C0C0A46|nr:lanthionine synthetase C family protein [Amycolatopsis aidingensis]